MIRKFIFPSSLALLILILSSCNIPLASGVSPLPPETEEETLVALAVIQTNTALAFTGPPVEMIPSTTPSFTLSPTPQLPMVTVTTATNCRTGPGEPYDIIGALPVGVPAEVVGRNASGDTWIIKLPSNPAITCWLWGYHATVTGDTSDLPVFTPPPTPTPSGNFTYKFDSWGVGPGSQCLMFSVTNTGSGTWESYSLYFENTTDGGSWTTAGDIFTDHDGWCSPFGAQLNLDPGEVGMATVTTYMLSGFYGDHLNTTLTLCNSDGVTGYCVTKNLSFVP